MATIILVQVPHFDEGNTLYMYLKVLQKFQLVQNMVSRNEIVPLFCILLGSYEIVDFALKVIQHRTI